MRSTKMEEHKKEYIKCFLRKAIQKTSHQSSFLRYCYKDNTSKKQKLTTLLENINENGTNATLILEKAITILTEMRNPEKIPGKITAMHRYSTTTNSYRNCESDLTDLIEKCSLDKNFINNTILRINKLRRKMTPLHEINTTPNECNTVAAPH